MHETSNERFVDTCDIQSAAIGVAVPVRSSSQRLADCETDALAGLGVRLVVLGKRVHSTDRVAAKVDESEGMVAFDVRYLLQVGVPQVQEPLAIFWQEPICLLVVRAIVRTAFPAGVTAVHQVSARCETELVGKIFRTITVTRSSTLI